MSDRFRFKAWISEEQFITDQLRHYTTDHGMWQWFDEDEWNNDYPNHNKTGKFYWIDLTEDDVLIQCTGIKDENEVLFYDGDIVKVRQAVDRCDGISDDLLCKVVFKDGSWLLEGVGHYYSEYLFSECDWCEIIGNRFENPELLELTND